MDVHKIDSIQAFRGLAFLCVFLSHVPLASTGPMGVSMFLVMSGFLMALSYDSRMEALPKGLSRSVRFGFKKNRKLYPLHLLTLALMVLYTAAELWKHGFAPEEVRNAAIALPFHLVMGQAWLPNRALYFSFNKVSWYLSVCVFAYTVFPFFFRKIKTMGKRCLILSGGGYCPVADYGVSRSFRCHSRKRGVGEMGDIHMPCLQGIGFLYGCNSRAVCYTERQKY